MTPQEKVDDFFSEIPLDEALRLLEFFKSKHHATLLRRKGELKRITKTKGPSPEDSSDKPEMTKAIGK